MTMDDSSSLKQFLDEMTSYGDSETAVSSRSEPRAPVAQQPLIGKVVEIAGSGSQVSMDVAALELLLLPMLCRKKTAVFGFTLPNLPDQPIPVLIRQADIADEHVGALPFEHLKRFSDRRHRRHARARLCQHQ